MNFVILSSYKYVLVCSFSDIQNNNYQLQSTIPLVTLQLGCPSVIDSVIGGLAKENVNDWM